MIKAHKKIGQTPLELLNQIRIENPKLKDETLSYAGRLDPMAEGEMLIMVGAKENKNRAKFLKYDKTYEAEILFGFSTDSLDIMGLINGSSNEKITSANLKKVLDKIKNITEIPYPVFSSKPVDGKPLFQWYREGRINEIEIPKSQIKIKKAKLLQTFEIAGNDLWNYINFAVSETTGDFRQKEILDTWYEILESKNSHYQVARIKFKVSSGTYIRSLAHELGREIGVPACLLKLNRTRIHNFFNIF